MPSKISKQTLEENDPVALLEAAARWVRQNRTNMEVAFIANIYFGKGKWIIDILYYKKGVKEQKGN